MPSLSSLPRPAFAHCSDITQRANQALNFYARHNNFTNFPEGMNCIASKPMEIEKEEITAGAWATMFVLLVIFVLIGLNRNYDYMNWSNSDRNVEQREEERTPFLAQEGKSI